MGTDRDKLSPHLRAQLPDKGHCSISARDAQDAPKTATRELAAPQEFRQFAGGTSGGFCALTTTQNQYRIVLPIELPTPNVRDSWHWSKRERWKKFLKELIPAVPREKRRRSLKITMYRHTLIKDPTNRKFAIKDLEDVLVTQGWLYDDSEEWEEQYPVEQQVDRKRRRTEIVIEDLQMQEDVK